MVLKRQQQVQKLLWTPPAQAQLVLQVQAESREALEDGMPVRNNGSHVLKNACQPHQLLQDGKVTHAARIVGGQERQRKVAQPKQVKLFMTTWAGGPPEDFFSVFSMTSNLPSNRGNERRKVSFVVKEGGERDLFARPKPGRRRPEVEWRPCRWTVRACTESGAETSFVLWPGASFCAVCRLFAARICGSGTTHRWAINGKRFGHGSGHILLLWPQVEFRLQSVQSINTSAAHILGRVSESCCGESLATVCESTVLVPLGWL